LPKPFDLEQFMEEAREGILDHGHIVHYDDSASQIYRDLPRAFTAGRTMWERPELMISGPFTEKQMSEMLDEAVAIDVATELHPQRHMEFNGRRFLAVEAERSAFMVAMNLFNHLRGLQLVWLNADGTPGEPQVTRPPSNEPVFEEDAG
jgi:hypothetical protein